MLHAANALEGPRGSAYDAIVACYVIIKGNFKRGLQDRYYFLIFEILIIQNGQRLPIKYQRTFSQKLING
jgi:hypothetical protein